MSGRPDFIHGVMEFIPGRAESMFVKSMQLPTLGKFTSTLEGHIQCMRTSFIPGSKKKKGPHSMPAGSDSML